MRPLSTTRYQPRKLSARGVTTHILGLSESIATLRTKFAQQQLHTHGEMLTHVNMTITPNVKRQFFAHDGESNHVIRLPPAGIASPAGPNRRVGKPWTKEEHERFLEGLQMFPNGPWRRIATHVGTRTSRQTMTHAQKYRERISRLLVPPRDLDVSPSPPAEATAPLPHTMVAHEGARLDDLDLEILSCLLDDGDIVIDDLSLPDDSQDDVFGDLLQFFAELSSCDPIMSQ